MKKKILCTVLAAMMLLFTCLAGGCGGSSEPEGEQEGAATQNTLTFVNTVTQIGDTVTLSSGARIEIALTVYDLLTESEKKNADVIDCKTLLDGYKAQYDALKAAADAEEAARLEAQLAARFVEEVEKLPNISMLSLSDKAFVASIRAIYEQLSATTKNKSDVVTAYAYLVLAEERIVELEQAAHEEEVRATAQAFIEAVEEIEEAIDEAEDEDVEEILLNYGNTLEGLLYDYEYFTDEVKEFDGVAEAKGKLDEYYAQYIVVRDEHDVREFIRLARRIGTVTLESEQAIKDAELQYRIMSDAAKADPRIASSLELLQQARAEFDRLFAIAERERIEYFIEMANRVRTDVENVDITWYDALYAASNAYYALTYDSMLLPEVEAAFNRWNAAQKAFDKKGYQQIPMRDPILVYSGDNPPHIVLQNDATMFNPIMEFYKVSSIYDIGQYAIMWLNIYKDGVFVARGEIVISNENVINNGHIIKNSAIQAVFRSLATDHSELVSGGTYGFSINFEDRNNQYIPSKHTNVSANKAYTW